MNLTHRARLALIPTLTAQVALGDQLTLENGDKLSGRVIEQNADEIVLDTDYAGRIKIKRSAVATVVTEQPLRIRLEDGRQADGVLLSGEAGVQILRGEDGRITQLDGPGAIASIAAIPAEGPVPWEWRGNLTFAGQMKTGNTQTDKLNIGGRTVLEQKTLNRFTVQARLEREETQNILSKEQYLLSGKYDRFFTPQWYAFVGTTFEQDKFKDLDLRSTLAAGSGYQFYDREELRLSLEAGLSYTYEDLIAEEDNSYGGLNWGFNWEQALFDKRLNFFHRHRGNQGFDESDNLIINASTGLRLPIMAGVNATAQYDVDWDRSPPDDAESTDQTYSVGVGYDW